MPTPFPAAAAPLQALTRVYDGDVDGHVLRFYLPPAGQPDMPWVAFADVMNIGDCPMIGSVRTFIPRLNRNVSFGTDAGAKLAIIPFWLAAELIRSARSYGTCDPAHSRELYVEGDIALNRAALLQPHGEQRAYRDAARARLNQQFGGD